MSTERTITLRFAGQCSECGKRLQKGSEALWSGPRGSVRCVTHGNDRQPMNEDMEPISNFEWGLMQESGRDLTDAWRSLILARRQEAGS